MVLTLGYYEQTTKLAGILNEVAVNESHGQVVAKAGEFKVEHDTSGDVFYIYDGENTVRVDIPYDDFKAMVIQLNEWFDWH